MSVGPLIIVSGASGCGKTTIIGRLLTEQAWPLRLSVSVTTRKPRRQERDGVDYYFWNVPDFAKERDAGGFLEWADVFGNFYGTPVSEVTPFRERGQGVLLDIDVQGREQVRNRCPEAVSIFILTSSFDTIEARLRGRHTESEEAIQRRLQNARTEIARAVEYDYRVINDDLESALTSMRAILGPLFERSKYAG